MIMEDELLELLKYYPRFNIFIIIQILQPFSCESHLPQTGHNSQKKNPTMWFLTKFKDRAVCYISRKLDLSVVFHLWISFFLTTECFSYIHLMFHLWRCWAPSTPKSLNGKKSDKRSTESWVLQIPSKTFEITFSCRYNLYTY